MGFGRDGFRGGGGGDAGFVVGGEFDKSKYQIMEVA